MSEIMSNIDYFASNQEHSISAATNDYFDNRFIIFSINRIKKQNNFQPFIQNRVRTVMENLETLWNY